MKCYVAILSVLVDAFVELGTIRGTAGPINTGREQSPELKWPPRVDNITTA